MAVPTACFSSDARCGRVDRLTGGYLQDKLLPFFLLLFETDMYYIYCRASQRGWGLWGLPRSGMDAVGQARQCNGMDSMAVWTVVRMSIVLWLMSCGFVRFLLVMRTGVSSILSL